MRHARQLLLLSLTTTQLFCAEQKIARENRKNAAFILAVDAIEILFWTYVLATSKENSHQCAIQKDEHNSGQSEIQHFYSQQAIESFRASAVSTLNIEALLKNGPKSPMALEEKKEKISHQKSSHLLLNNNNRRDTKHTHSQWNNHHRYNHS